MTLTLVHPANGRVGPHSQVVFHSDNSFAGPTVATVNVTDDATLLNICVSEVVFDGDYTAGTNYTVPAGIGVNTTVHNDTDLFDIPLEIREDGRACTIGIVFGTVGPPTPDSHAFAGFTWDRVGNILAMFHSLLDKVNSAGGGGSSVLAAVQQVYQNNP